MRVRTSKIGLGRLALAAKQLEKGYYAINGTLVEYRGHFERPKVYKMRSLASICFAPRQPAMMGRVIQGCRRI